MAIHLSRIDELALVALDRPEALNALSASLLQDLAAAFDQVGASDARALLITGAGERAFCALTPRRANPALPSSTPLVRLCRNRRD